MKGTVSASGSTRGQNVHRDTSIMWETLNLDTKHSPTHDNNQHSIKADEEQEEDEDPRIISLLQRLAERDKDLVQVRSQLTTVSGENGVLIKSCDKLEKALNKVKITGVGGGVGRVIELEKSLQQNERLLMGYEKEGEKNRKEYESLDRK
jgi:hypothetical protein